MFYKASLSSVLMAVKSAAMVILHETLLFNNNMQAEAGEKSQLSYYFTLLDYMNLTYRTIYE